MKGKTLFLKAVIVLMALPVLAVCIFVVPPLAAFAGELIDRVPFVQYFFMAALYATAIAYFAALYQTLKLLGYIDRNVAFSALSIKALQNIKRCALVIAVFAAVLQKLLQNAIEIKSENDLTV